MMQLQWQIQSQYLLIKRQNGCRAVKEQYNWDIEEKRLLALYEELFEN